MAKLTFNIYPKSGLDYTFSGEVSNLKKFLFDITSKGAEAAGADSKTTHAMEQLYMDEYDDDRLSKIYNSKVFASESRRNSIKSGRMRPLRSNIVSEKANSNG